MFRGKIPLNLRNFPKQDPISLNLPSILIVPPGMVSCHCFLLLFLIQLFLRNQLEDLKFDKALSVIRDLTPIFTYFTFKDMGQITSAYFFLSLIKPLSVGVYS